LKGEGSGERVRSSGSFCPQRWSATARGLAVLVAYGSEIPSGISWEFMEWWLD